MKILRILTKGTKIISGIGRSGIWICIKDNNTGTFLTESELIRIYNRKKGKEKEIKLHQK